MVDDYSSKSFRLMAMAVGVIPKVGDLDLVSMSQQQIEARAVEVQLLALVILTNHVRPDSKPTIAELQEGYASLSCCMSPLTAPSTALLALCNTLCIQ